VKVEGHAPDQYLSFQLTVTSMFGLAMLPANSIDVVDSPGSVKKSPSTEAMRGPDAVPFPIRPSHMSIVNI
jgi:hypothetical protein